MKYTLKNHTIVTAVGFDGEEVHCEISIKYHKENKSLLGMVLYDGESFTCHSNGIELDLFSIINELEEEGPETRAEIEREITDRFILEENTSLFMDIEGKDSVSLRFIKGICEDGKAMIMARVGPKWFPIRCGQNRVFFNQWFPPVEDSIYRQIITLGRAHWHEQTYHADID